MTKFSDQLFDDLMEEHGHTLAGLRRPAAPKRHLAARPVLLTAGAGGIAAITAVGTLVAGGGTPAYAVTPHDDGTVTLAVYQKDGIAPANDKLRQIGDGRVVLVPVGAGCPSITSLKPGKPGAEIRTSLRVTTGGGATVDARGVPAGETLVVALQMSTGNGPGMAASSARLTSGKVPSCVSIPKAPPGGAPGQRTGVKTGGSYPGGGSGTVTQPSTASGPGTSAAAAGTRADR